MLRRDSEQTIRTLLRGFPVITLTGPRQSGKTVIREFFKGLEKWQALAEDRAVSPTLIYGGPETYQHKGIRVTGWQQCGEVLSTL